MRKLRLTVILIIATSFVGLTDIYEDISSAIRNGDARRLISYIGASVDLTIGTQEAVYSKAQAEQILHEFFSKNTPKSFTILHKGSSKEGIMYAIGTLVSASGKTFRTSFYFKHSPNSNLIQELRFETE